MSTTPLTDTLEFEALDDYQCRINVVSANLARRLERGLASEKLKTALREQDMETIREIITKGGTAAEVLKFLETPYA